MRDSASEALGVLWKFLGEGVLMKLMPDLDAVKLAKVKEFAEKAELSGKPAAAQGGAPAAKKGAAKVVKPSDRPKPKPAGGARPAASRPAARPAAAARQRSPEADDDEPEDEPAAPIANDGVPRVDISEKVSREGIRVLNEPGKPYFRGEIKHTK